MKLPLSGPSAGLLALLCLLGSCATEGMPAEKREVKAPFSHVATPLHSFQLDPSRRDTLRLPTGTHIVIPANALVDGQGRVVQSGVTLQCREFHDVADILLSGIPMRYDSAGEDYVLKSAGMIELRAEAAGAPVFIAEGRSVSVSMASFREGDYNLYYLDESTGNWQYRLSADPEPNAERQALQQRVQEVLPPLHPPKKPLPDAPVFSFAAHYQSHPELAAYRDVKWQNAPGDFHGCLNPGENPWIFGEIWQEAEVHALYPEEGIYLLKLQNANKTASIAVRPVLEGQAYEDAVDFYQKAQARQVEAKRMAAEAAERLTREAALLRSFPVTQFGVFNWDVIMKKGQLLTLAADFQFEGLPAENEFLQVNTVYLIMPEENTVVAYSKKDWKGFKYSPKVKSMLLAVLPDERVAMVDSRSFAMKVAASPRQCAFVMAPAEQRVSSPLDLKYLLKDL